MHEIQPSDLRTARNLSRGHQDAESAACEALVKAADKFDGRGDWVGFSIQRMQWAIKDLNRQRARRAEIAPMIPWDDAHNELPETERTVLPDNVVKALNALPPEQREALLSGDLDRRKTDVRKGLDAVRCSLGLA